MERTDFESWNGKEVARLLALVENQRRYYQEMVASLPVGLVVLSANRTVVSANRAFRQAFGLRIEDLRGKSIERILPSDRLIEKIREMTVEGIPQPGFLLPHAGKLLRIAVIPLRSWDEETQMETLLMIDEFQEFFSEDDKLAQDAGVLLDRLVRQGRAFGIHVLLGSQTIGGSSGLARSTIGQMAVRIALQTSEADSQLILGDNNSAARLLSRPGEAIYNDAGGRRYFYGNDCVMCAAPWTNPQRKNWQ